MIVFDEGDSIVPNADIKALVHELHELNEVPAFFIPTTSVFDLLGHGCLIGREMLVANQVVEILRERNLQEGNEDGISVVGEAPQCGFLGTL